MWYKMQKVIALSSFLYIGFTVGLVPVSTVQVSDNVSEKANISKDSENSTSNANKTLNEDIKHTAKELELMDKVNLESILKKLNDEDMYENVSEKDNMNERSYIYIHGSKYRVPFLNSKLRGQGHHYRMVPKKKFNTFVSNIDSAEFEKFDESPAHNKGLDLHVFEKTYSEIKTPENAYFALKEPYYEESLATDMNREMAIMTNKVNTVNGIIDLQLHEYLKMKDDLTNPYAKVSIYGPQPGRRSKSKPKPKQIKISSNAKQYNDDTNKRKRPISNKIDYSKYGNYPVHTLNEFLEDANNIGVHHINNNNEKDPETHREVIELMKTPMVRPNSIVRSKPKGFHMIDPLRPFVRSSINYIPVDVNINDIRSDNTIKDSDNSNLHNEPNSNDDNEEAMFEDPRLINTLKEMKQLTLSNLENNQGNPDVITKRTKVNTPMKKKHYKVKSQSQIDDCLYPECFNQQHNIKNKCNCDVIETQRSQNVESMHNNG